MKTITAAIEKKWDTPGDGNKAADVRVFARFYKWTDKADHSLGFTQLGEIDLTHNLRRGALPGITEEIENDIDPNEAAYGTIKASQVNLEFADETGTLYKRILTENDTDNLYKYNGDAVHKWGIVIKIGDVATDNWIEFEYIYGWLFDPDNQDIPRWAGVGEPTPQKFNVAAFTLLKWLGDIGSAFLGDMHNPMGFYASGEVDPDYKLGNYPVLPTMRKALNKIGVMDNNITVLRIPPIVDTNKLFSTIICDDKPSGSTAPDVNIPEPRPWKTYTDSTGDVWSYTIYTPGWGKKTIAPRIYIIAYNRNTGYAELEIIDLRDINSNIPNGWIRRLWNGGEANIYYLLLEENDGDYRVLKLTLSGTIGGVADNTTAEISGTIQQDTWLTYTWYKHWGQCDLNQADSRLYGAQDSFDYSYWGTLQIGYWDLVFSATGSGTETWNRIAYTSAPSTYWAFRMGVGGDVVTGFRCVRTSGGDIGICMMIVEQVGSTSNRHVQIGCWDSSASGTAISLFDYDSGVSGSPLANSWARKPLVNGAGTIGGFSSDESGTNKYYFCLPGHNGASGLSSDRRTRCWMEWEVRLSPSTGILTTDNVGGLFRTFGSPGSAALEYCMGWKIEDRAYISGDNDYTISLSMAACQLQSVTGNKIVLYSTDARMGDDNEWPIISAPSCISDTALGASQRSGDATPFYKPFSIFKSFTGNDSVNYDRNFLCLDATYWLPNFSFDFYRENPSLADVFRDIAKAHRLLMKLGHDTTIIRPRNDITDADKVITPALYIRNAQKVPQVSGYDRVELTTSMDGSVHTAGKTGAMARVLSVDTDFVLPNRGDKRAAGLYDAWKDNKLKIILDCRNQSLLEPGDIVDLHLIIPPGGKGYTDGEDAVNAIVIRITNKGQRTQLEAISVDAASSIPV